MSSLIHKSKDDIIRRRKDRRDIMWRMEDEKEEKIQKKTSLEIGDPNDKYEQEADAVANKVVNGGIKHNSSSYTESNTSLMAKSENGTLLGTEQLQAKLNSSKGSGQSVDPATQNEMGSKMGADLNDVKIHTDTSAHEMSEGINAKAFTHGQDIYFKQGNYDTNSTEGKKLLAHELTHTQQQRDGVSRIIQKQHNNDFLTDEDMPHKIRLLEGHLYSDPTKSTLYIPKAWGKVWAILVRDINLVAQDKSITYGDEKDYVDLRRLPKGTYFVSIYTTKNPFKTLATKTYKVVHDLGEISEKPDNLQSILLRGDPQLKKTYASVYASFGKGSGGSYVRRIQYALLQLNYDIGEYGYDGSFGDDTEQAVIKFQEDYFLKPDGMIGPDTLYQLDRLSVNIKVPVDFDITETDKRIKILGKVTGAPEFVDSSGYITAKIEGKTVGTSIAVKTPEVIDLTGKSHPETILSDNLIDLRSLGQGIYFIKLSAIEDLEPIAIKIIKTEDATITLEDDKVDPRASGMSDRLKEVNPINQIGRIAARSNDYDYVKTKGVNAYINPGVGEEKEKLSSPLLYNTEVHVIGTYKSNSEWLLIQNKSGESAWINGNYVKYPLPSHDTNLHFIQSGEQLMDLALRTYGKDCDFIMYSVAVIAANKDSEAFYMDGSRISPTFWDMAYSIATGDMQYLDQKMIFQSVELKAGYNIWLPSHDLVKVMRSVGTVITSDKWTRLFEVTVEALLFFLGVVVGVFIGIWKGIVELVQGIADLVVLLAQAAWALISMDWTFFKGLWDGIVKAINGFPDMIAQELEEFAMMNAWDKGVTVGTIIGMLIFEILLAIFTAGVVTAIKWTGKFSKLVKILRAAPDVDDAVKKVEIDPPDKSVSDDINKKLDESENKDSFEKKEEVVEDKDKNKDEKTSSKKTWQQHEIDVTKALEKKYGKGNVATQVTMEVTGPGGKKVTIRIDNLVRDEKGNFKLIDAKHSDTKDLTKTDIELEGTLTNNQKDAFPWIKNGQASKVEIRGVKAEKLDLFSGEDIVNKLSKEIEIHVNDFIDHDIIIPRIF